MGTHSFLTVEKGVVVGDKNVEFGLDLPKVLNA